MQKKRTALTLTLAFLVVFLSLTFASVGASSENDYPLRDLRKDQIASGDRIRDIYATYTGSKLSEQWLLMGDILAEFVEKVGSYVVTSDPAAKTASEETYRYWEQEYGKYYLIVHWENAAGEETDTDYVFIGAPDSTFTMAPRYIVAKYRDRDVSVKDAAYIRDSASLIAYMDSVFISDAPYCTRAWSDWATDYVKKADALFLPDDLAETDLRENATRSQFCALAYNLLVKTEKINPDTVYESPFTDESDHSVAALSMLGIIKGTSDTTFSPYKTITREEAATILDRLDTFLNEKQNGETAAPDELYADDATLSDWARESVYRMREEKILIGKDGGNFAPRDNFTLEQSITALLRLYDAARSGTNV